MNLLFPPRRTSRGGCSTNGMLETISISVDHEGPAQGSSNVLVASTRLDWREPHVRSITRHRVQELTGAAAVAGPVIDVGFRAGNLHFMAKTAKPLEPEVVELDDFFVHVAVSRDAYLSRRFQCEVSLYPRDADSQWSDLDLSKPAEEPQVLRAFVTRKAAYEHGIALGHILSSIY